MFALPENSFNLNVVFIILAFVTIPIQYLGEDVFFISASSKLASSDIQSTVESIRSQMRHSGCLLAGLLIGLATNYYFQFMLVTAVMTLVILVWIAVRYKTLSDPKPILKVAV